MEASLETQLASIRATQQEFNQQMELPAPLEELARLTIAARQHFQGYDVPQAYLNVLAIANGVEWNGASFTLAGTEYSRRKRAALNTPYVAW